MNLDDLNKVAVAMTAPGKGILAADESTGTISKRFDAIGCVTTRDHTSVAKHGHTHPKHRPASEGRDDVHLPLRPAESHARPRGDADRAHPEPKRMTTVAFQGQGGGLPHVEWTLGSVLKTTGLQHLLTGK